MKLTDSQRMTLQSAANHAEHLLTEFPENLKGAARHKVIDSLVRAALVKKVPADERGNESFAITSEGLAALGQLPALPKVAEQELPPLEIPQFLKAKSIETCERPKHTETQETSLRVPEDAHRPKDARAQSKQSILINLLRSPQGATIDAMVAATGWQSHTVRGAMAGALKKKLGLTIVSDKTAGSLRVYRIA